MNEKRKDLNETATGILLTRLDQMIGGWFIGQFRPAAFNDNNVEVAVKEYPSGYKGELHYHKIATEVTVLLSGRATMGDFNLSSGDIITIPPGISTSFIALSDCITIVVKLPGVLNDKYLTESENA